MLLMAKPGLVAPCSGRLLPGTCGKGDVFGMGPGALPAPPQCWWEPLGHWGLGRVRGLHVTPSSHHRPKKGEEHLGTPLEKSPNLVLFSDLPGFSLTEGGCKKHGVRDTREAFSSVHIFLETMVS